MQLSPEDSLRLNVLLAQELHAVRIDESKMIVYALTSKGEAKVPLNPTGKDEAYIKEIKALFSTHVMGSPGGYPVYLKRWTRMGQARDESLSQLLLLGEPEAVVAVVHAQGLTDELAARAWWAMPSSENARQMLDKPAIASGETGKVLAEFLLEFLPFEEEQNDIIESVRLVLQPGLISDEDKQKLWARTKTKRSFYVGFLHGAADDLPIDVNAHSAFESVNKKIFPLSEKGNPHAKMLLTVLSANGQSFIQTAENALKKPGNQDVVISLLAAISNYFETIMPEKFTNDDIEKICAEATDLCSAKDETLTAVISSFDDNSEIKKYCSAMIVLACLSVKLVNPIFSHTDAIGTVMRKKIIPVTDPIFEQLKVLSGK